MPTYDYLCEACGHRLEIFQSMTDSPKRKCPECGRLKLARQIGMGAGILFKGSGFYETDYRSDSYKKGKEAESKKAKDTKGDSGSGGKSESSSGGSGKSDSKASGSGKAKKPA